MTHNRYQLWTSDMVIGAAIVIIGFVAALVRLRVIEVRWTVSPSPMVIHLWPLLLIGAGVVLLFDHEERRQVRNEPVLRNGGRQ